MKRIVFALGLLVASLLPTSCSAEPVSEADAAGIEAVVGEYYEAFSAYDIDRLEAVFTEQTWREEGWKIRALVPWAKLRSVTAMYLSVKSIRVDGDSCEATAEFESSGTPGEDIHRLARTEGGWRLCGPLNVQVTDTAVIFTRDSSCTGVAACCP